MHGRTIVSRLGTSFPLCVFVIGFTIIIATSSCNALREDHDDNMLPSQSPQVYSNNVVDLASFNSAHDHTMRHAPVHSQSDSSRYQKDQVLDILDVSTYSFRDTSMSSTGLPISAKPQFSSKHSRHRHSNALSKRFRKSLNVSQFLLLPHLLPSLVHTHILSYIGLYQYVYIPISSDANLYIGRVVSK